MRSKKWIGIIAIAVFPLSTFAGGIFNLGPASAPADAQRAQQPVQQQGQVPGVMAAPVQGRPAVAAQSAQSTYKPTTPAAASAIQPIKADPKAMAQFDRYPNESDESYIARMKLVYERSAADLERASRENLEKLKALAPPK
ncbi:hypothetical protein [Cupriavidus pinatubonensis]|uniref:Transmembrane protein n=1 Tax=Cupriavidus pinatubonensis TaxID=248026 RepID=A0ABN7Y9C9_9BURK|nr:hypothetical protein [Cupriavidus pinatubonensis]CAG9169999.1 hypothetical protein LMG23994_01769 [Cupriavidus pinatubonensis]